MDVSTVSLLALFAISVVPLAPTELTLIGMGMLAAQQGGSLAPVILVATAGCLLCDAGLYLLGRYGGGSWVLDRVRRRPSAEATLGWLTRHARRRPVAVLVVSRWLPAGGTAGSLLVGSLRWPRSVFAVASAIGVTLWVTYAVLLGYLGGELVQQPFVSLGASLAVAALLAAVAAAVLRRHSGHDLRYASGTAGGPAVHPAEPA
ncbi:DedA family protein [Prauserella muralis]|uniref:VTT domain-containing protein n=1 Tax=Prauserella muralis TaxID=588067 RepID=A0A2V4BKU4_9PSEU|nr:VTT domain-containing protein [Prauserella muralis]PXY31253.1 hypothetical protein BAY60_02270 [Prauserella muralis]TWE14441.1 membrane protein DedA with SNARE-associated domain [Prauserella muralis]